MGEVYRARDTRLHRDVALKILPVEFATDRERRERFEREAQAAARLDHPHIASVYDVGVDADLPFIVSELVEGTTLRVRLERGPLSASAVLRLGAQVAEALAAAHERSIVHRDIKPENILVTADDAVKVVDFGVAKIADRAQGSSVTTTIESTARGIVIGTASYMSPEQVRGETVDHRSDIFSLGAVLFEMATGSRAFAGTTAPELMAAVLRDEPRPAEELRALPPGLSAIIMRCLDKRQVHRFQSARDLAFALQNLPRSSGIRSETPAPITIGSRRAWRGVVAAALGIAVLGVSGFSLWIGRDVAERTISETVQQLTFDSGIEAFPNLSRDGSLIVYAGSAGDNRDIFLRDVRARESINLTAGSAANNTQPALSPDGQSIVFRSDRDGGGIFVMNRTGGPPRRVTRSGFNPTWSADGRQIAAASEAVEWRPDSRSPSQGSLQVTDVVSGESRTLSTGDAVQPSWSPNGHRIAYWGLWERNQRDLWTVALDGSDPVRVTNDLPLDWDPTWSPDGRWLYFSSDRGGSVNLWRVSIDERSGETAGEPEAVLLPASWAGHARLNPDGQIIYTSFHRTSNLERIPFDPIRGVIAGAAELLTTGSNFFVGPRPSRDGRLLAFHGQSGSGRNVFISSADGSNIRQVTTGPARESGVNWKATNDTVVFYSAQPGRYQLFSVRVDGSELRQLTDVPGNGLGRAVWSNDGQRIATYETVVLKPFIVDVTLPGPATIMEPLPPLADGSEFDPYDWSSDDSRILGQSTNGAVVVYSVKERTYRQLVARGGGGPRWLPDGRRILYSIGEEFFIVDEQSGESRSLGRIESSSTSVGRTAVDRVVPTWSLSSDARWLYRPRLVVESDLWLLSGR